MKQLLLVIVLAGLLGWLVAVRIGKSADARAYATVRMADQRAADMAQQRRQDSIRFELEQAEREAMSPHVIQGKVILVYVLVTAVGVLAIVVAGSIGYLSFGAGHAGVVAANVRARQIPMRPETMHYPLFVHNNGHKTYLIDLNTGLVVDAGQARSIVESLAQNSGATRQLGVQPRDMVILNSKEK